MTAAPVLYEYVDFDVGLDLPPSWHHAEVEGGLIALAFFICISLSSPFTYA